MQLKELMTGPVETISPSATVRNAAEKMDELNVGFMPVAENGHPQGVLTDRDIALRVVAAGRNPEETTVRDVMTENSEMLSEESDVQEAVKLMMDKNIRRVLVGNGGNTLKGVVSLGDLAVALDDKKLTAEALQDISQPAQPRR